MSEIDPITGLPKELASFENIAKETQKIIIRSEKKRFGKIYTIIEGMDTSIDIKDIGKKLKTKLACGGSVKNEMILLQGNHMKKTKTYLVELGFSAESIEVRQ